MSDYIGDEAAIAHAYSEVTDAWGKAYHASQRWADFMEEFGDHPALERIKFALDEVGQEFDDLVLVTGQAEKWAAAAYQALQERIDRNGGA